MYPDLRPHSQAHGSGSGGFWPTFTDIMTVIMMIFLMAFIALFSRNNQLVSELTSALAKTQQVEEVVRLTEEQKSQLEEDLLAERARLNSIRLDLAAAQKQLEQTQLQAETERENAEAEIQRLAVVRAELNEELSNSRQEIESTSSALSEALGALSLSELRLKQGAEETQELNEKLALVVDESTALKTERDRIQTQLEEMQELGEARNAQLSELELSRNRLISELSRITGINVADAGELTDVELMDRLSNHLVTIRSKSDTLAQRVVTLEREQEQQQSQYRNLKVRYDELVKPARSTKDKRVIEVKYFLEDGTAQYRITEPGQIEAVVSLNELNERLGEHQAMNPDDLYVKVVIPDDSGLSFDEAWRFTNQTLNRFDYYYQ